MGNYASIDDAKRIMKNNFIGPDELSNVSRLALDLKGNIPSIPYTTGDLKEKSEDYLLILGLSKFKSGKIVSIRSIRQVIGVELEDGGPYFYNQDWYENENFIDVCMERKWFLVRQNVYENSRAVSPGVLLGKYKFPSAITCTYAFFIAWFCKGIKLWYHDFVWCSDTDHNGDRIYVGRYHDPEGINKDGFNIHRHLELRECYGCID